MPTAVATYPDTMSGYNQSLDMENVQTPASDYSSYSHGNMMSSANGPFLYSQTVPTDLNGSVWDATAEGTQNFQGDCDESSFFGQMTSGGLQQDPNETMDDMQSKWMSTADASALASEPMRRISSRSSTGSHKYKTIKSSQKTRPRILSTVSQGSQMSNYDLVGNAQMDAYLLQDSDAHSVASSQMYYPTLPISVGGLDGLPYSPDVLSSSLGQQHMDPSQIQLDFEQGLAGNSPSGSWSSSLSPIGSRISSPALQEDAWANPMGTTSPLTSQSSPVTDAQSPSRHPESGLVMPDDIYGQDADNTNAYLSPPFARRSSGEGESSARDHPLYKNAMPQADGLFHCPWEGHSSCNHRPEKLKCNYDKFVDSHLKPYRCKNESCQNARFSSTACLLRHEREAHAMHGHGDKPYLCPYEGCDRSIPGSGFPRNWNLRDHMRRVHNDNGSSLALSNGSSGRGSHSHSTKGRKRKSKDSTESSSSGRKPSKSSGIDDAAAAQAVEQPLFNQWWEHRHALDAYLQRFNDPVAFDVMSQCGEATEHVAAMEKISRKIKKSRDSYRGHIYG